MDPAKLHYTSKAISAILMKELVELCDPDKSSALVNWDGNHFHPKVSYNPDEADKTLWLIAVGEILFEACKISLRDHGGVYVYLCKDNQIIKIEDHTELADESIPYFQQTHADLPLYIDFD